MDLGQLIQLLMDFEFWWLCVASVLVFLFTLWVAPVVDVPKAVETAPESPNPEPLAQLPAPPPDTARVAERPAQGITESRAVRNGVIDQLPATMQRDDFHIVSQMLVRHVTTRAIGRIVEDRYNICGLDEAPVRFVAPSGDAAALGYVCIPKSELQAVR